MDNSLVWNLDWLTPARCRIILLLVLAAGFFSHVWFLNHNCPIDLAGDEAQYWDWSRHLDLSYYSKGPLVAYIIRGSCAIFGETMPAVRYPALLLSVGTSVVTYLLTKKLFDSERLALGAVLLFHIVLMFIAGSVLMTVDPPMFFCWALATYFAAIAIFDDKPAFWILVGIAAGLGFLAKYAVFLWFVGLFGFLICQRWRKSVVIAVTVALLFTIPVIIWNFQHHWVSLRHVAKQTGAQQGTFSIMNPLEMIASQIGIVGPTFAVLMIAAFIYSICRKYSQNDPNRQKLSFLAWIGGAYFAINFLASFRAKIEPNWPAPAYFTLTILTAYFMGTRLKELRTWKPWRGWFYATIIIGLVTIPLAHDMISLPVLAAKFGKVKDPADYDVLARLRGWQICGQQVSQEIRSLGPHTFVLCDDYQQTAEMAFYVQGQPNTYCAGSYFGKRFSQYDMWPDRRLDATSPLIGRDAIYVGKGGRLPVEVEAAFDHVGKIQLVPITVDGVTVKNFKLWRCYHFKGMAPSTQPLDY